MTCHHAIIAVRIFKIGSKTASVPHQDEVIAVCTPQHVVFGPQGAAAAA
jgi:hypothetical protein